MSDSDSSHHGVEYKSFRRISRERLLGEMLGSIKAEKLKTTCKVLIMDKVTVKIMSYACKMTDITDAGISLVEVLFKRRQPLPSMDAVYFIQPSKENVVMFLSDMSGKCPLYKKAYVFFSSPVSRDLVDSIKRNTSVLARVGALREMNLEYFVIDNQGYITDNELALEVLFGENMGGSRKFDDCLNTMASRVATVFASMKELPYVRYRAARSLDASTLTTLRDLIPTKFAAALWNCLEKYKSTISEFPKSETCELLILDRSIDQIAPVIHAWTYGAMCHDLLNMEGNKYVYEVATQGETEKREVLLQDHDPIWVELQNLHFADASERLHMKMQNFISKNKAAQIRQNKREGDDLSTRDLQKMVQALPQYSEQIDKLTLHVDIAQKLNEKIGHLKLHNVGQLEEDLVFGQAGSKEVIQFLRGNQDATAEVKMRLLMIYASIYPEKFEGDKGAKLMQLARLSPVDTRAITNMRFLGSPDSKKTCGRGFSLKFDMTKRHTARKERPNVQEQWKFSKFYPVVEELIIQLSKGELPKNDFPCMNDPTPSYHGSPSPYIPANQSQPTSMRSRRPATWARPRPSDDGYSSDSILRQGSSDLKKMGQRIFVFIIGGATRSEVCSQL